MASKQLNHIDGIWMDIWERRYNERITKRETIATMSWGWIVSVGLDRHRNSYGKGGPGLYLSMCVGVIIFCLVR